MLNTLHDDKNQHAKYLKNDTEKKLSWSLEEGKLPQPGEILMINTSGGIWCNLAISK